EQRLVTPGEHATAGDVARDRAHDQKDGGGRQEPEPRGRPAEDLLVHGTEDVVDPAPENPQQPRREENGNRDEEARDEANLEPVAHRSPRIASPAIGARRVRGRTRVTSRPRSAVDRAGGYGRAIRPPPIVPRK